MRRDAALADRRHAVQGAARGWRRAGAIDETTLAAVLAAYPDDRARLGPIFRSIAFVAGLLAVNAFFGVIAIASQGGTRGFGVSCLIFALMLVGATELLLGPLRRADSGIETATALLAIVYAVVGVGCLFEKELGNDRALVAALLGVAVLLSALASVRWGSPLLAFVSGVCGWLLLARLPSGRLLWLLSSVVLAPLLLRASESPRLPPVHRRSLQVMVVLALCAFYLASHLGSLDYRWLERFADFRDEATPASAGLRPLSILATALVPAVVAVFGVLTRRAYLMDLGVLLGIVSLGTLRFYVHVAPAWLVLCVAGAAALVGALLLRRFLAGGRDGERAGFTAQALFEDPARRRAVEVAGVLARFTPAARTVVPDEATLQPGGGRYGGGGASGEF